MPLVSRLVALLTEALGGQEERDPPDLDLGLAVAALLVHVARVDGNVGGAERERLTTLLMEHCGVSQARAERLIERAKALDDTTGELADLVETVAGASSVIERRRMLRMAYTVAAADGVVHELEESLVWRVGRLLGFEEAEIVAERPAGPLEAQAPENSGP